MTLFVLQITMISHEQGVLKEVCHVDFGEDRVVGPHRCSRMKRDDETKNHTIFFNIECKHVDVGDCRLEQSCSCMRQKKRIVKG